MKYVILGHENPDFDSIVSGFLLQKLLKKQGHDVEFIIPDKKIAKKSTNLCIQVGIDPTIYQKDLPLGFDQQYILVDHHERDVPGEIIAIIDHHPTDKDISCPVYHNIPSSSTAMIIVRNNEDQFDVDDIFLAVFAGMVDTAAFHSKKTVQSDVNWAKEQCEKHGFNYDELLTLSTCPIDITNLEEDCLDDLKSEHIHGYAVASSCLALLDPTLEEEHIQQMIGLLKDYRQENNYDLFVFIVHDVTDFKTTVYKISEDGVEETKYDEYTSRGSKIIPQLSNELKSKQKIKSTTTS